MKEKITNKGKGIIAEKPKTRNQNISQLNQHGLVLGKETKEYKRQYLTKKETENNVLNDLHKEADNYKRNFLPKIETQRFKEFKALQKKEIALQKKETASQKKETVLQKKETALQNKKPKDIPKTTWKEIKSQGGPPQKIRTIIVPLHQVLKS